jgi:hypothetical protein
MKSARKRAEESFTFKVPHETFVQMPDGDKCYRAELTVGRRSFAANWAAYTSVVQACRVVGGTVVVQPISS